MDRNAKTELATLLKKTWDIRESSYIKGTYTYKLNWWAAASQATSDPELIPLLAAMLGSGFADFITLVGLTSRPTVWQFSHKGEHAMYWSEVPMFRTVGDWLDSLSLDSLHALYLRTAGGWRVTAMRRKAFQSEYETQYQLRLARQYLDMAKSCRNGVRPLIAGTKRTRP